MTLLIPGGMHTAFFDGRTEQYKPPPDAKLNQPEDVAETVVFACPSRAGCEVREMVVVRVDGVVVAITDPARAPRSSMCCGPWGSATC